MKKLFYLSSLFVFALFMISCDSDDDNNGNQTQAQLIVGTWEIYELNIFETYNEEGEDDANETISFDVCDPNPLFVFSENGSLTISDVELDITFDGEVSCEVFGEISGTWEYVSGNTFILESENEPFAAEITFSNGNNRISIKQTETDVDGNYEFTFRGNRL